MEVEHTRVRLADDALASTLSGPVFERTQGQPLFIASLLKYYIDQRAIIETDDAWRLSSAAAISQDGVPNDLLDMITYQVGGLTEDERRLLDIASVAGVEFSAALVAAGLSATPSRSNVIRRVARKDHTLVPSHASEWPTAHIRGHMPSVTFFIKTSSISTTRAQTSGANSQAFGHRLEKAYHDRTGNRIGLALHFEQGRDFRAPCAISEAAESSAKRLGHAEAASYLTRALGFSIAPAVDRFEDTHRRVATAQPCASLMRRSCRLRE